MTSSESVSARLDAALAETARAHGPGLFALVTDAGEVVFEAGVGVAALDSDRPITAADRFRIGSVTKTYVTALVLRLAADGALAFDDSVEHWLPGLVPGADEITVEHLLRMRSGLPDYTGPLYGDPSDPTTLRDVLQRYWSPQALVEMALGAPDRLPLDTTYRYCNTDYILLGLIVEAATGERVEAQLWQKIFQPLQLDQTTFPTVDPHIRGPHADGHLRLSAAQPYVEFTTFSQSESWTAGAIITTPHELARFFDALFGGELIDAPSLAHMTDCNELLDERHARGLGIVRYSQADGSFLYGHHGGVPGFTTLALHSTAGRTIVLYQNGIDVHDILTSETPFIRVAAAV